MAATVLKFRDSSNVLQIPSVYDSSFPSRVGTEGSTHILGYFNYRAEDGKTYMLPCMKVSEAGQTRIMINTPAFGRASAGVSLSEKNIHIYYKNTKLAGINDYSLLEDTTATGSSVITAGTYTQSQFASKLSSVGFTSTTSTSKGKTTKTTRNIFSVIVDGKVFTCKSKTVTVWAKLTSPSGIYVCDFGKIIDSAYVLSPIHNFSVDGCYILAGNTGQYSITVLTDIVFN